VIEAMGIIKRTIRFARRFWYLFLVFGFAMFIWYWNCLPKVLFNEPTSTILLDRDGNLLAANISGDGQWRFPETSKVPDRFKECIIQFEDKGFETHHGVSIKAICRAAWQNTKKMKVVSGGSTITMQLARLIRGNPPRTLWEKFMEMVYATRLEIKFSKKEIISMYASHAPYGGNVVGIDAAAWRYFGRPAAKLSWAESATLAVLPNAPSLIFPGKNHEKLLAKRDRLLKKLLDAGKLDSTGYSLASSEPLPGKPYPLPQLAPHLMQLACQQGFKGKILTTSIDPVLQESVTRILEMHHSKLKQNQIYNGAALVISVKTGEVLAYVGNMVNEESEHGSSVDLIQAPRSTGSILKPLLYAEMLNEGKLMPKMLVPDVPTQIGGYSPKNFNPYYDGAVHANHALSRSLNIPAVRMLNDYGPEKFCRQLYGLGLHTINKSSSHYGLSVILGGAEATLWDLCGVYANMGRTLDQYPYYEENLKSKPTYIKTTSLPSDPHAAPGGNTPALSPSAVWSTFEAMVEVNRPEIDANWKAYSSSGKIAWKTGTSFGFRDAWAIGVTPGYVVGVWVGNADGEGRPGIAGIKAAAPILFDVFGELPQTGWFKHPVTDMEKVPVCRMSGHRASPYCEIIDSTYVPSTCLNTLACPYHQQVCLDKSGKWIADADCEQVHQMKKKVFFVLPPLMEKYYRNNNPAYEVLPKHKPGCVHSHDSKGMYVVYPKKNTKILVPVQQDGTKGKSVFEVVHRNSKAEIHWHLDNEYLGSTTDIHQMELAPDAGKHILMLEDEFGQAIKLPFEVE
jgi:penicillin-binding protein 1C